MNSRRVLEQLRRYESRNITFIDPEGEWPIVWERARGAEVWDADGRKYLDLTAAFGVAAAGHGNLRVIAAARAQMDKLLHAMGDVHPHAQKAQLARELSRITFERWTARARGKVIFCNSGFEAVEAALKTAMLAAGKPGVVAFRGAYHGLGYGALNVTERALFREPFRRQLREFAQFIGFPRDGKSLAETRREMERAFRKGPIGAVLVETMQVRGGINLPPPGFLRLLRQGCDRFGALLILDELYTGFGRTGKWFACEHEKVVPDLICLGKALTGGFPLSACVGKDDLMDRAWPASSGEAIHTSTFLGHPVGCAMALANIAELRKRKLVERSAELGAHLLKRLRRLEPWNGDLRVSVRGRGLLAGVELCEKSGAPATSRALRAIKELLHRGVIFLPEGEHSNIISFSPPLVIARHQLDHACHELERVLLNLSRS